jgi:ABC-type transport system substrate-binding protein
MKKLTALLLALIMVFALVSCGSESSSGTGSTAQSNDSTASTAPETLTVGTSNVLGTMLPWSENETCYWGCYLVYDYLFYWDDNNEAYSDILSDWYYEDDGTTFVMVCRDDVYFSNGDQMTGEDVYYSIYNLVERETNAASFYATVDWDNSYVSDDGMTVYLANTSAFGPGITNMDVVYLLDKSWCEEKGFDDIDPWINSPCGSGPYEVVEYVTDSHVTLKLRDNYWGSFTGGAETVQINYYADSSTMYMALEGGEIDIALNIAESDYSRAVNDANIAVELTHEGDVILLAMDSTNNEYLADENVRLAIAYGVNWEEVAQASRGELAEVATSVVTAVSPYYEDVGSYEYDFEKAKGYMEDSGYVVDGSTINFSLYMHTVDQAVKTNAATVIQYYLAQLGIDLQTNFTDFSTAIGAWLTPGGTDMNFQDTDTGSVCGEPYRALSNFADGYGMLPACVVTDETFNQLFQEGSFTTDDSQRASAYKELQEYVHEHALIIPIYESIDAVAFNSNVVADVNFHSAVSANLRFVTFA